MHLLDYRDALWREVDHAPGGSPEAVLRTNKDIERALFQLFGEAPYLFRKEERVLHLDQDLVSEAADDTLEVAADISPAISKDAWVLQTTYSVPTHAYGTKWGDIGRQLDGRMLRITDPDDDEYYHYFRIREAWLATPDSGDLTDVRYRLSLTKPVPASWFTEELEWRIFTSEYALPNDIIRIAGINVDIDGRTYPVTVEHEGLIEDLALLDNSHDMSTQGSRPFIAYRRQAEGLKRPLVPPGVSVDTNAAPGTWDSATSPFGLFEYFWTLSWGFRKIDEDRIGDPVEMSDKVDGDYDRYMPYWESAPSPVSEAAAVTSTSTTVTLTFPNMQRVIGFNSSSTVRYNHTGLWINIYRRRVGADAAGVSYASEHAYLVARIQAENTSWVDDGTMLPAHSMPLRENTKYQTLRFHPFPDERYRIRLRAYVRPIPPKDDYEDVPVPDDAQDALIFLAAQHFYRRSGNAAFAAHYQQLYMDAKSRVARTYGQAKPRKRPARIGMAKARASRRGTHRRVPTGLVRDV